MSARAHSHVCKTRLQAHTATRSCMSASAHRHKRSAPTHTEGEVEYVRGNHARAPGHARTRGHPGMHPGTYARAGTRARAHTHASTHACVHACMHARTYTLCATNRGGRARTHTHLRARTHTLDLLMGRDAGKTVDIHRLRGV